MQFNDHSNLAGRHAFMSASKSSWLNYSDDIFTERFYNQYSATIGELLHELAAKCIRNKMKISKRDKSLVALYLLDHGIPYYLVKPSKWINTLSNYVNDAIEYGMEPEQILYFSYYTFGTTDAIQFEDNFLRIHDLKTGTGAVHIEQLLIYAALFCLEYRIDPQTIECELRIYQNEDIIYHKPSPEEIETVMDRILYFNEYITKHLLRKSR